MDAPATQPGSKGSSQKTTLTLIAVILAIAIGIAVYFYYQGKKKGDSGANVNISSPLNPDGTAPAASDQEIKLLATDLYNDMDGINAYHNLTPWNKLLTLSDSDFIRLNNSFNVQYQAESEQSFKQWVEDESTSAFGSFGNANFATTKSTVLAKMKKLNIA